MGAARLSSLEDLKAGVEDRAYRLHYNKGQRRVDLFANVRRHVCLHACGLPACIPARGAVLALHALG